VPNLSDLELWLEVLTIVSGLPFIAKLNLVGSLNSLGATGDLNLVLNDLQYVLLISVKNFCGGNKV